MADLLQYEVELDKAPQRDVTAHEFRTLAHLAGWQPQTIELFLQPPLLTTQHVLVGKSALRLRAE